MIYAVDAQNLEELANAQAVTKEGCLIPLFHGTRRYALQTTAEERVRFFSACDIVMNFAKKLAVSNVIDEARLDEYQRTQNSRFLGVLVYTKGISRFTYGDFYLTSSYTSSLSFAHNIGGELGDFAYAQCIGFRDFGVELDECTEEAVNVVLEESQKYLHSEKIVLAFYGVRFEDLSWEGGDSFLLPVENEEDEEYNKYEIKRLQGAMDTDRCTKNMNFRLANLESYTPYVVGEKLLKEGFSIFTKITDVDKYIKEHNRATSYPKWEF